MQVEIQFEETVARTERVTIDENEFYEWAGLSAGDVIESRRLIEFLDAGRHSELNRFKSSSTVEMNYTQARAL